MSDHRVPIIRRDTDGAIIDGTARLMRQGEHILLNDFRDLDGHELELPPGSSFEFAVDLP